MLDMLKPCLSRFIAGRSWLLFHLVGRHAGIWWVKSPEEWPQHDSHNAASEVAIAMLVVNDCAECNIKSITDYIHFTRSINRMLLVGEDRHSLVPKLNWKNLLNAKTVELFVYIHIYTIMFIIV